MSNKKITKIETFLFDDGTRVEFAPISNAPPCTHRVYIMKRFQIVAKDWFVPTHAIKNPGKAAALFYYEKHKIAINSFEPKEWPGAKGDGGDANPCL
jgi:hypothetical protein